MKFFKISFNFLLLLFLGSGFVNAKKTDIVAIVGDSAISSYELEMEKRIVLFDDSSSSVRTQDEKAFFKTILDDMVERKMLMQISRELGFEVDDLNLSEIFASVAEKNGLSVDQMTQLLLQNEIDPSMMIERLREQVSVSRLLKNRVDQRAGNFSLSLDAIEDEVLKPPYQRYQLWVTRLLVDAEKGYKGEQEAYEQAHQMVEIMHRLLGAGELIASFESQEFAQEFLGPEASEPKVSVNEFGWVDSDKIPPLFLLSFQEQPDASIIGPLRGPDAYFAIYIQDTQGYDETLSQYLFEELRFIGVRKDDLDRLLEDAKALEVARDFNAQSSLGEMALVINHDLLAPQIPPNVLDALIKLEFGQWTQAFDFNSEVAFYRLIEIKERPLAVIERTNQAVQMLSSARRDLIMREWVASIRKNFPVFIFGEIQ